MAFGVLWGIDAAATGALAYFFLAGVADGSISSSNIGLWSGILAACFVILAGSVAFRKAGRPILGNLVLAPVAIAAVLYILLFGLLIASGVRWN